MGSLSLLLSLLLGHFHWRRYRGDNKLLENAGQGAWEKVWRRLAKKKTASLLPGLIDLIVSFIFKAAGQAISLLAEHISLLILAMVAFLMERFLKCKL